MENNMLNENQEPDFQIKAIVDQYASHWKWFILGVFVSLLIAYLYLRYYTPQYQAATTILVKDEKKGGMLSELSAFADMGIGGGIKNNLDNEVEILKSRTLIESVVKKLNLNTAFIVEGNIVKTEVYQNPPIMVNFIDQKPGFFDNTMEFKYVSATSNTFELEDLSAEKSIVTDKNNVYKYGQPIQTKYGTLVINKSATQLNSIEKNNSTITIILSPLENTVESFKSRLKVNPLSKTSSVVEISLIDPVLTKAEDFLDVLVQNYNEDAVADKNLISENTSKFIANRLQLITEELEGVEQDVQSFKNNNQLTDIETEAKLFIEGSSEYDKKGVEADIQLNIISSMLDFMKKSKKSDLLPANIVSGEATEMIGSYNQLVLDRNRIMKSATEANPTVIKIDQQLSSLKSSVASSLSRMQSNLSIQKRNLNSQEGLLTSKLGKIPVQERQFRVIARQQKVKEELYLYLLEKREETAISLAATAPNARVIDAAKALIIPVSPKNNIIYLAALLLGLLIPFGIIYIMDLLDTKVKSRMDIADRFNIPFLGDVPRSSTPNEIIDTASRSSTAEALRIVRANLDFMLNQVPDGSAKSIFLTSTIAGEGKTFLSVNLAYLFAHTGKKVLLMGMDIRKPKLNEYIGITKTKGLTDYLSSKNEPINDFITKYKGYENFDVLLAGTIPPNPTELLMNSKVDELFVQFKKEYDFIIVDTAPVSLVSDTLIIAKYADTFVYVVRANHMDKRMLYIPDILHRENKLPNMAFILNDTEVTKGYGYGGYGYGGYGYGVIHEKKPWYKEIFKK